jgi:hypothetical protein
MLPALEIHAQHIRIGLAIQAGWTAVEVAMQIWIPFVVSRSVISSSHWKS